MILDTDEEILEKVNQYADALSSLERELPHAISSLDAWRDTEIVKLNFFMKPFDGDIVECWSTVIDFSNLPESYEKVLSVLTDLIKTRRAYITF